MDLVIPANPDAGFSSDVRVRTTTINGVRMVSAMDILRLVIGSHNNASEYWSRLLRDQPEMAQYSQTFKFKGPGQRDTPVVDARGTVLLINALPGKTANRFRAHSAEIVVRNLGGDETLVDEIHRNAERQRDLPSDDPWSMFGDDMKRRRTQDDTAVSSERQKVEIEEARVRIIQAKIQSIEAARNFLMNLGDGGIDGPTALLLKDAMQNTIAPLSTRMIATVTVSDASIGARERHQMPISDLFQEITGKRGTKSDWVRIGAAVAKEYRNVHPGKEPNKVERFVDGTTRNINAYSLIEDPWIRDFVEEMEME